MKAWDAGGRLWMSKVPEPVRKETSASAEVKRESGEMPLRTRRRNG